MTINLNISNAVRRAIRTALQFVVSGGLTALVTAAAGHLPPLLEAVVMGALQLVVTFAQNYLENKNVIPIILAPKAPAAVAKKAAKKA